MKLQKSSVGDLGEQSVSESRRSVEDAIENLQRAVHESQVKIDGFETTIWPLLLSLGVALVALWVSLRNMSGISELRASRGAPSGFRSLKFATRFGRVMIQRPFWRKRRRGAAEFLLDERLGLRGGFSLGVVAAIARLSAQMAFSSARRDWRETYGWAPSSRGILRMVDAVGSAAGSFLEALPAPEDDGEVLVIQVDGKGAPMLSPLERARRAQPHAKTVLGNARLARRAARRKFERVRRAPGKKSKNARNVVVGVIYSLKKLPDGTWDGPKNKRIIALFGTHDALVARLQKEAQKRGSGKKRTLFLADGAEAIWKAQGRYFPNAEVCIDWYHVAEKLWTAAECLFKKNDSEMVSCVERFKKELRTGQTTRLIDELSGSLDRIAKTGPGNKGRRKRLSKVINYLTNHKDRLRYHAFRQEGFDIGTGVVEGAVRNLVALRLDGPGMRWGKERSQLVLHLRAILLSNLWPDFLQHLSTKQNLRLAPVPVPASPYQAKMRAA